MYNPDNYAISHDNTFILLLDTTSLFTLQLDSTSTFNLTLETPAPEGTSDYNKLINKPYINGVEIIGYMAWEDFGIPDLNDLPDDLTQIPFAPLTNEEIDAIIAES
jgi:hypothetical protein